MSRAAARSATGADATALRQHRGWSSVSTVTGEVPPLGLRPEVLRELARRLQRQATLGSPQHTFLREVTELLLAAVTCGGVEILVRNGARWTACRLPAWRYDVLPVAPDDPRAYPRMELAARGYHLTNRDPAQPHVEQTLVASNETVGLVGFVEPGDDLPAGSYDWIADRLAGAIASQRAQAALRERVKELTCLYELGQLTQRPDLTQGEVLEQVAALLPPAWQYPEITVGRVVLDGQEWWSPKHRPAHAYQRAEIVIRGKERGLIEVGYTENAPDLDEGPFLAEERKLIDAIALQVAIFTEQREAARERAQLAEQLRHADRLATIGQLAAGVAHELNEPLGNILGLTELVMQEEMPASASADLRKVVDAALFAREIIKKLMLFARQTPPRTGRISVNAIVRDGMFFLQAQCARAGIEVERRLDDAIPEIVADSAQIHQVLVNLVVNAIQAMPDGGALLLETRTDHGEVVLAVQDSGVGMTQDVASRIFYPFFTTKDIDQGTGLGLAVVHGIVTAHQGTIEVDTSPGEGTRFEVRLPIAGPESVAEEGIDG